MVKKKVPAAVSEAALLLNRLGASKGGEATAAKYTPEERSERGRRAVQIRWDRYRKAQQAAGTKGSQ
jgi:hypothetical protein